MAWDVASKMSRAAEEAAGLMTLGIALLKPTVGRATTRWRAWDVASDISRAAEEVVGLMTLVVVCFWPGDTTIMAWDAWDMGREAR